MIGLSVKKVASPLFEIISRHFDYHQHYNYHFFELKHNNINLNDSIFILNTNYFSEIINSDLGYLSLSYEFDRDFRDFKNYPYLNLYLS